MGLWVLYHHVKTALIPIAIYGNVASSTSIGTCGQDSGLSSSAGGSWVVFFKYHLYPSHPYGVLPHAGVYEHVMGLQERLR